jgi:hypothetical protein
LQVDELLGAVAERLLKALREVRPGTVRQLFALADQHMRWELNDLARRLGDHGKIIRPLDTCSKACLVDWCSHPPQRVDDLFLSCIV